MKENINFNYNKELFYKPPKKFEGKSAFKNYLNEDFGSIIEKNKKVDDFWTKKEEPKKINLIHSPIPKMPPHTVFDSFDLPKPDKKSKEHKKPEQNEPEQLESPKFAPQWAIDALNQHYKKSKELQAGFMAADQFVDDPNKLTVEERRRARIIARLAQKDDVGLDKKQFGKEWQVAFLINSEIDALPYSVKSRGDFGLIQKRLQELVSRYLVGKYSGLALDVSDVHDGVLVHDIKGAIQAGVSSYLRAFEVDIPLYEKLFDELDELRVNGRDPLEVYLGRDGIYAYVARRAQDIGERRRMSWQERKVRKQAGEEVGLRIKYLVYPRVFRDTVATLAKHEYLIQNGISREADPIFYDTGFIGTIPEQIMEILGFDDAEIDSRMKLLSAEKSNRKVKSVDDKERTTIVNQIEHNAKPEEVAIGLFKDPASGKIKPVAQASRPEEQLMYGMVRTAISNYYYTKAKEEKIEVAA